MGSYFARKSQFLAADKMISPDREESEIFEIWTRESGYSVPSVRSYDSSNVTARCAPMPSGSPERGVYVIVSSVHFIVAEPRVRPWTSHAPGAIGRIMRSTESRASR